MSNNLVTQYLSDYFIRNQSRLRVLIVRVRVICRPSERKTINVNYSFHTYNTLRRLDIHPSRPTLSLGKRTFRYSGEILFNSVPETYQRVASLKAFK